MTLDKNYISEQLKNGVGLVRFTKANGEIREMRCTLNAAYLPPAQPGAIDEEYRAPNPEVVAVWDLDKNAWRSFRVDSVLEFNHQLVR